MAGLFVLNGSGVACDEDKNKVAVSEFADETGDATQR